jgi:lipid-binding SYLF domain-containing protein
MREASPTRYNATIAMDCPRAFVGSISVVSISIACQLLLAPLVLAQEETPDKRLQRSAETLREVATSRTGGIPLKLLEKARCIVIVPDMKKAAFVVGGEYGRGFASCRIPGSWSAPAPVRLTGGSFGVQLGADSTDIILLVMNQRGLERLLSDKFALGVDVNVAAGPVGRDANADTDALMHAEIIAWSRSRGAFAGVALNGTVVERDRAEAMRLYGRPWSNREIIRGGVAIPDPARVLTTELGRDIYSK